MENAETLTNAPRRRETFTSVQLQRAADQLQEAIQSVRQRRSMHASSATSLSLLSELSSSDDEGDDDQENTPTLNLQSAPTAKALASSRTDAKMSRFTHQPLRRYTLDASQTSVKGSTLSLTDLHASPVRQAPTRTIETGTSDLAQGQTLAFCPRIGVCLNAAEEEEELIQSSVCDEEVEATPSRLIKLHHGVHSDVEKPRRGLEEEERKALTVLQEQVEAQARSNRAVQDEIGQVLLKLHSFVDETTGETHRFPQETASAARFMVTVSTVAKAVEEWMFRLQAWRDSMAIANSDLDTELKAVKQQTMAEMEQLRRTHDAEREHHDQQVTALTHQLHEQNDRVLHLMASAECAQMQAEDMYAQFVARDAAEQTRGHAISSVESTCKDQERHILSLLAQLKQAELRELQWEMMYEEQLQATMQAQDQVGMLLEDAARVPVPTQSSRPCTESSPTSSIYRRDSFASSAASSDLHLYQQRIELLEAQLQDVKEQVRCDHAQYLYEQQKWAFEKKHVGHDVEEVHGVSVKVLKLLLLREKLLKREEKKMQRRVEQLQRAEAALQAKHDVIHRSIEIVFQESAVALMYVRQLALAAPTQAGLPLKPVKLVRLLKRLKLLQEDHEQCATLACGQVGREGSESNQESC